MTQGAIRKSVNLCAAFPRSQSFEGFRDHLRPISATRNQQLPVTQPGGRTTLLPDGWPALSSSRRYMGGVVQMWAAENGGIFADGSASFPFQAGTQSHGKAVL